MHAHPLPAKLTGRAATALLILLYATACAPPAGAEPEIAPHAATYTLKLSSTRARSPVADVSGRMTFAWRDVCDGWTIEQRFDVKFTYAEGEEIHFDTSYVTWEAKGGDAYRFNVRKLVNGEVDEELRGEARLQGDGGGSASYSRPEPADLALPSGTLFPTAHTIQLLRAAAAGESFMAGSVFDGSEKRGANPVSAVIGRPVEAKAGGEGGAELRLDQAFPVHLAFFPVESQAALPEYVTRMLLQRNGVVQSMTIDYGDFQVDMTLDTLEAAPRPRC